MKIKYKPWAKVLMYLVEAIVIILSVFPILWVIMSSFKTNGEILSSPLALPAHLLFQLAAGGGRLDAGFAAVLCHGRVCHCQV